MEIKTSFNLGDRYFKEDGGVIEEYYVSDIKYKTSRKHKDVERTDSYEEMEICFYKIDGSSWTKYSEERALILFLSNKSLLKLHMMERLMAQ